MPKPARPLQWTPISPFEAAGSRLRKGDGEAQGRASITMLVGVSVARRIRVNPA